MVKNWLNDRHFDCEGFLNAKSLRFFSEIEIDLLKTSEKKRIRRSHVRSP